MTTAYQKTALTGGTATSLDGIDGSSLSDGDFAFVMVGGVLYTYILDASSGATESSPDVISPDTNAGTKRWILQQTHAAIETLSALENVGLAATVGSKALTVALKGVDGANPSTTNPVVISFRDETLTTGTPNIRTVTSALSVVLASGGTLGFTAAEAGRLYVWAIDNAGTVELALSRTADIFPEGNLVSTTAIGSGSDSAAAMYSTSARTNVACRCIGYIEITTGATAGEWDNSPTKIQIMGPGVRRTGDIVQDVSSSTTTSGTTASAIPWDNTKPQISEGAALLSRTITPTSILNKLVIDCNIPLIDASATTVCMLALFKNSDADALTTGVGIVQASSIGLQLAIHYEMTAGSVSELIFSTRVGPHSGTMAWLRGYSGDVLNGTLRAYLRVKEVFA